MISVIEILENKINELRLNEEETQFILYKNEEKTCLMLQATHSFNKHEVLKIEKIDEQYKVKFPQIGEVWGLVKSLQEYLITNNDTITINLKYSTTFNSEKDLLGFIVEGLFNNLDKI